MPCHKCGNPKADVYGPEDDEILLCFPCLEADWDAPVNCIIPRPEGYFHAPIGTFDDEL